MKKLEMNQMECLRGRGWADDIDLICAISGTIALRWEMVVMGGAFCAGWSLGRVIQ